VRHRAPGCLRRLSWIYRCPAEIDWSTFEERLQQTYEHRLVRAVEHWGPVVVKRYVLQFQVEFRLGQRPDEILLLHRVTATAAQRLENHRTLEALLSRA
jgi:hypothetical protein